MLYVDDKLATHPKIFRAGAMLGENGPALAFSMFIAGLGYAREHLTDGFIPDRFVASCGLVQRPQAVAKALSSRAVSLWHRTRGGYTIHDYHDWNQKASEIKAKRAAERERKRRQRHGLSRGMVPAGHLADLGARARPRSRRPSEFKVQGQRTSARGLWKTPNPRILKALVLAEVAACQQCGRLRRRPSSPPWMPR